MIEGLKVTIPGQKLRELCLTQAKFHVERAAFYKDQYDKVRDAIAAAGEAAGPQFASYTSGQQDPKAALSERRKSHDDSARELSFIAENLNLTESYVLNGNDLQTLGIRRGNRF